MGVDIAKGDDSSIIVDWMIIENGERTNQNVLIKNSK